MVQSTNSYSLNSEDPAVSIRSNVNQAKPSFLKRILKRRLNHGGSGLLISGQSNEYDAKPVIHNKDSGFFRKRKTVGSYSESFPSSQEQDVIDHGSQASSASPTSLINEIYSPEDVTTDTLDIKLANQYFISQNSTLSAAEFTSWLAEEKRIDARNEFMNNFKWTGRNIVSCLRELCQKLYFRGESQHLDRVISAFAKRWCDCNLNHGFKSTDIVYIIVYSILILNTDLHWADHSIRKKITRAQFISNTIESIKGQLAGQSIIASNDESSLPGMIGRSPDSMSVFFGSEDLEDRVFVSGGQLANDSKLWYDALEQVLKSIYHSINKEELTLKDSGEEYSKVDSFGLKRTNTMTSGLRNQSSWRDTATSASSTDLQLSFTFDSLSIGESSMYRNTRYLAEMGSMYRTSMSSLSLFDHLNAPIGLAGAVNHAIIQEETSKHMDDLSPSLSLISNDHNGILSQPNDIIDVALELRGAPWAKEGIVKHIFQSGFGHRKSKYKSWTEVFVVVQRGYLKTFSFASKSSSNWSSSSGTGHALGGGNWTENANMIDSVYLGQTIASHILSLKSANGTPIPTMNKVSKLWMLALPNKSVHIFESGTSEISEEFVSTCNYWAARLSKEPLQGGISNIEYGWSEGLLSSVQNYPANRKKNLVSMIREWKEPQANLFLSNLDEVDQLEAFQTYIDILKFKIQRHDLVKQNIIENLPDQAMKRKAINNWVGKNLYLHRERIKFGTYAFMLRNSISLQANIV
ncbi:hypothetical protein V1514DRAFT_298201 [Lipomyces japonicus]|uniref:uncharacterized protein n=1 Tax=Lipomyces japonicus TaxID=56871 RepID=UPI0034CDB798